MNLPILKKNGANDLKEFINFWSKLYSYHPEMAHLYSKAILKPQFDEKDLQDLFIWKNGMPLSKRKQSLLDKKIKAKLSIINTLKTEDFELSIFTEEFKNLTAVWKIFLLHIIKPDKYSIYDQHIHRTFNFINGFPYNPNGIEPLTEKEKENFYFNEYFEFIRKINGISLKTIDEAFFVFGQFLKLNGNSKLVA